MRIIFMGSPEFSVPVLDALIEAGHDICAVYCQPPRPAGRGKKDRPTAVHARAEALGLSVRHPVSLKGAEEQATLVALNADIAVVVAYGLILPQAVLDAPTHGCLNIHASLLPRWRGAAPIHRAIIAGDAETGVCIMQMDAGLDTGAVLLRRTTPIGGTETTGELHDRLSVLGAEAIVEALAQLGALQPVPQPEEGVTYAAKIDKAEARIDWTKPAIDVVRQINGLSPFPGAWAEANGERVKFLKARPSRLPLKPGETSTDAGAFIIGAGSADRAQDPHASVSILSLQRQGKRAAPVAEILKGWTPPATFD